MKELCVLLIEDNDGDAQLIREYLNDNGQSKYTINHVNSLNDGLNQLNDQTPDVVLLDLNLPDCSGKETFETIHKHSPSVPVVVLTGQADHELALDLVQEGAQDYLNKNRIDEILLDRTLRYSVERNNLQVGLQKQKQLLFASEKRFGTIIAHSTDGILILDKEKRIQFFNPAAQVLLGRSHKDLAGATFKPEPLKNRPNILKIHRPEKDDVTVEIHSTEIEWDEGRVDLVTLYDITEQEKAQNIISRMASLVEQASEAIIITDLQGRIEYVNPAFERQTGYSFSEAVGETPRILKSEEHKPEFYKKMWDTITAGKIWHGTFKNKHKDGSIFYEDATVFPIRDGSNTMTHFAAVKRNTTEERRLHDQLNQAQKLEAIGQLAGGVAHDFNNILTAINGYSDLILMTMDADNEFRKYMAEISKAGKRAGSLVRQLLTFSRKQIIEPRVVQLNSLITDILKMLNRLLGEDIELEAVLADDLRKLESDPAQLEQILINLAVNARDAINEKTSRSSQKKITIETRNVFLDDEYVKTHPGMDVGWYVELVVSDNGVGMSDEVKNKIFEPFFTTKTQDSGTGLGLATIYGIVKQNNGSIYVYSELGSGTTFKIFLPCISDDTRHAAPDASEREVGGGNEAILFVEDDADVRSFAVKALRSLNYNILEARNGVEALQILEQNKSQIQLIVTDVVMPDMGGKELADNIQKLYPDQKILFTSGYTDDHIIHAGVLIEGVNFLQKPYSIRAMAAKIRDILDS